jgi:DNA-binding CsgD family transcriptional regulator
MSQTFLSKASALDVFTTAMDLVFSSENANDLCRKLVHSTQHSTEMRGAFIYSLNARSNLIETAGYGQPFEENLQEISAWDENPASNAIRAKQHLYFPSKSGSNSPAVIAIPLMKGSTPIGVCVLVFAADAELNPLPDGVGPALSKLGAYFLETHGFTPKTGAEQSGRESIEDLTTRQVSILGFMGDGLTNADISHKVLLSESTVRQETIRIYRALAVAGRQEAVAKARALGLIKGLSFNPPN